MEDKYRKSGIDTIGDIPWGTHMCQLYRTKGDLLDVLVPYFRAGLENNEFCMWVTSEPLGVKDARASLGKAVRDLDDYISKGQIEILDYSEWYTKSGKFNTDEVLQSWVEKEREALEKGFNGLRATGNTSWLGADDWVAFRECEVILDSVIGEHRIIAICTYSLNKCEASELLDVMNNHEVTLIKQNGLWRTVESDERKRLKKMLTASEVRFRRLFETTQDGILILDADTEQITDSNPFIEGLLGYTVEELLGKKIWEIGLFKDLAKSEDAFKKLQSEGYIRYEDLKLETKDGKSVDVEFISNVYDVDHKKIIQCNIREISKRKETEEVSEQYKELLEELVKQRTSELAESNRKLLQELTERKQAEESLRITRDYLDSLIRYTNAPTVVWDPKMRVTIFNMAFERLTGYMTTEVVGQSLSMLFPETNRDESLVKIRQTIRDGHWESVEIPILCKNGGIRIVLWNSANINNNSGKTRIATIAQGVDITEQKQAEEREKQLQHELNVTSRLVTVGEMAAGIAHEINNPLTGVVGFSDLLLKKDIPEDTRKDVSIIYEGARRIASIIDRMLRFARQTKPERKQVNVNDIIETTLAMRESEMKTGNINVTTELAPDLPLISADAGLLQQAFLNIILNAEQAMKEAHSKGGLTVKTEKMDNTIRASFKDDGPGIAKKNIDKLFNPFFTTKEVGQGTGLGLSICYSIIKQHDGKIYAESTLGKGTTFFIELPVVDKGEQLKLSEPAAGKPQSTSKARILVIDDDPTVQEFITAVLTEEGHEIEIVDNGDDAMERLSNEEYDVILLDIKLPGMSGIEIYEQLQKSSKSLTKKVIFITGDVMSVDTMVFIKSSQTSYIAKPFDAEKLVTEINIIISQ
ncbi:MEDS domain-containing protein [Chloroflexota bacterium]